MRIFLDIETVPSQRPDAREQARIGIKPPATFKKAESIANWWLTEADAAADEIYKKQSLDGGNFGEIVSIAACTEDGREFVMCRPKGVFEHSLLTEFGAQIERWIDEDAAAVADGFNYAADPFFIAHNAIFDLGFLWRRCVVTGVKLPFKTPSPSARCGKDYDCTMQAWSGFGGRISLAVLCRALGVESPKDGGIDGSKIFDAWTAGEYEKIASYNLKDAIACREVWHRMQVGGAAWAG